MAIDRVETRRRVRTITGWAAAGALALTAAAAFGASRGSHAAKATPTPNPGSVVQDAVPQGGFSQQPQDQQGFTPPSASTSPPAAMSGGS